MFFDDWLKPQWLDKIFFSRKCKNNNQFNLLIVDFIYFLPVRIFVEIIVSYMEVKKMPKFLVFKSFLNVKTNLEYK